MKARTFISLSILCLVVAALLIQVPAVGGLSSTIVISQIYGGGGNSGATLTNDFIELFNRGTSPVNVTGWTVQYASASGTTWQTTTLNGTIDPGKYLLVQQAAGAGGTQSLPTPDAAGSIAMSATAGKVALVMNSTALAGACPINPIIIDFVGYGITANCSEGSPTANLSNTTAALRANNGCMETDSNSADFTTGAPNPRNSASPAFSCGTGPTGPGAANPSTVAPGGSTLLTVNVTPGTSPTSTGLAVTADLGAIGGSASQQFFDNGTNGDLNSGDNIFSFQATVSAGTSSGGKILPVTITDAQMRSGNATIALTVEIPAPEGMVISQVYGGGGNSGATLTNDFIELFNRGTAAIDISGWSVQYASAAGSTWQVTPLAGTVMPGQYFLVQQAAGAGGTQPLPPPNATGGIAMAAGAGKVALVRNTTPLSGTCPSTALSDFVGYGSTASCFEGMAPTGTLSNTTAALRMEDGCQDTNNNSADFSVGAPAPRNSASPFKNCFALSITGEATPNLLDPGDTTLLTARVKPAMNPTSTGLSVVGDLTSIGGAAVQMFFDDGTNGDATASDNIFSFQYTIPASATPGDKDVPVTVTDAQTRSASDTIQVLIVANLKIHEIQGNGGTSPHVGTVVRTEGVVTGRKSNGFFMQLPDAEADGDPMTSEGIFVFTSSAPPAAAAVGNRVEALGTVAEFRPDPLAPSTTELVGQPGIVVTQISAGNPLPTPVTLTASDTTPGGGHEQLERFEGMRVHVASLTVVAPTGGFLSEASATSMSNGRFFGVITGVDRPFREPGIDLFDPLPMGSPCCVPRWDANPERIRVQSGPNGVPFNSGGIGSDLIDVAAGMTVTNLVGPLEYAFRTWTILPEPASPPGIVGMAEATPVSQKGANEYTVASFNMQRFYDTVNDPMTSDAVLNAAGFERRLSKASHAIRNVLRLPDILSVQEMENLSTLQTLADRINSDAADPMVHYEPYLVEGNDIGGIDVGFLVNTRRVSVIDVTQEGKDTTYINPNNGLPEILNDRPPLILRAEILSPLPPNTPVTVIVNHLRSFNDIESPVDGNRVRTKRRAQAEFLANLVQARQAANPEEFIIVVGDFNAFPFNDGYGDIMGTIRGMPVPADQVVLPSADLVNPDLANLSEEIPAQRYSYSFDGSAQILDQILISANLLDCFSRFHYARSNADFPDVFRSDEMRPERLSDHDMPVAYFFVRPIPVMVDIRPGVFPNAINLKSKGTIPVAILSTADFDARLVDPATVLFAGAPVNLKGNGTPQASLEDVNGDGRRDLVLHFSTQAVQIQPGDTEAILTGMLLDGRRIRGKDFLVLVP